MILSRIKRLRERLSATAIRSEGWAARTWLSAERRFCGYQVESYSTGNVVSWDRARGGHIKITMVGGNNRITVHKGASVRGFTVNIIGSDNVVEIGEDSTIDGLYLWITESKSRFSMGRATFMQNASVYITDNGGTVEVGSDCMIAGGALLRCGDGHAIFDVQTGEILNQGRYIRIEDHVWLTTEVVVLKDVTVGYGSVVGARSIVTRDIPRNVVAAGAPAKTVRADASWRRENIDRLPPSWFNAGFTPAGNQQPEGV